MKYPKNQSSDNLRGGCNSSSVFCWRITTKNLEYSFTNNSEDLFIDGNKYLAGCIVKSSSIEQTSDAEHNNYEVAVMFDDVSLDPKAMLAGDFDQAYVEIAAWVPDNELKHIYSGYIDKIYFENGVYNFNISGISKKLEKKITDIYSPFCRARFCDPECGVNVDLHTKTVKILAIKNNCKLLVSEDLSVNKYKYIGGKLRVGSSDYLMTSIDKEVIAIDRSFEEELKIGDKLLLKPHCNKEFSTCCELYQNAINFRGEPDIPGVDRILQTAGTR